MYIRDRHQDLRRVRLIKIDNAIKQSFHYFFISRRGPSTGFPRDRGTGSLIGREVCGLPKKENTPACRKCFVKME